MKYKLLFAIAMLVLPSDVAAQDAKEINILFLGNSFTARHNLSGLVKEVIEEGQPNLKVNVEAVIYGGQDLFRHHDLYGSQLMVRLNDVMVQEVEQQVTAMKALSEQNEAPQFYTDYWKKSGFGGKPWNDMPKKIKGAVKKQERLLEQIDKGQRVKWDYLVLQSWRDITGDIDTGYGEYAQKFAKIAKQQGTKVILYITAPHAQNAAPVDGPVAQEQTQTELKTVRKLMDRIKPFAVVPVPLAINQIQQDRTKLTFRYRNDFHPNQTTALLVANMFYAAMFKKSPEGLKFNTVVETKLDENGKDPDGGDAKVVFDNETKVLLQKAAYAAAMKFKQ